MLEQVAVLSIESCISKYKLRWAVQLVHLIDYRLLVGDLWELIGNTCLWHKPCKHSKIVSKTIWSVIELISGDEKRWL